METRASWPPVREPFSKTLTRNVAIALVVGGALALRARSPSQLLPSSLNALWFTLGGHYVEVLFLNGLRARLPRAALAQRAARVLVWFVGGSLLFVAMTLSARLLPIRAQHWPSWWLGGALFIGVELVVHALLAIRRIPSFYDGRG
jgi:hypothetical protein